GDGKVRLEPQELVEARKQRSSADDRQAPVADVGRELRRRSLEQLLDGVDDLPERPLERTVHLTGADRRPPQEACEQVATRHLPEDAGIVRPHGAPDLELQRLGLLLTDQEALVLLAEADDGVAEPVA